MAPDHPATRGRASGVLLPVFSLPSSLEQGDFGPNVLAWLDWLRSAQQTYWMILPLNPVDSTGSPYASSSAFALNPLFISPEILVREGWLERSELRVLRVSPLSRAESARRRYQLYRQAYRRWRQLSHAPEQKRFADFSRAEADWLESYAVFTALKHRFRQAPWWRWPAPFRTPLPARSRLTKADHERVGFERFLQWQAAKQWTTIRTAAKRRRLKIIGDVPFTVREDSVDVWAHPELFRMKHGRLSEVSGMPPDPFSKRGQRWGTPVYNWPAHRRTRYRWWTDRLSTKLARADLLRLDHFQGFIREWAIPSRSADPRRGRWVPAHGAQLFRHLRRRHRTLPLIAEDMGLPLPAADALRKKYHIPGTRIFQFSWSGYPRNIHALHHISADMMFMTSNHDLPPIRAWWERTARAHERNRLRPHHRYPAVAHTAVHLVIDSPAHIAITTMADILNLGEAARINRPATKRGNWRWRVPPAAFSPAKARWLARITRQAGRQVR